MKISLLTGKFGMGHMIVAKALKEHIINSSLEAEVEIIDWFDYVSPKLADKYYEFFNVLVNKGFKLYNTRYRILENKKTDQKPELYSYLKWHFKRFMEEKKPDIIISTLPLCSQLASLYKEKTGSHLPLITCVTDITGHSEWINKNTDIYMVGSYVVKDKFIKKGVAAEKIYETGIPVRLGFINDIAAKESVKRKRRKNLLIMGGGLGILPTDEDFYKEMDNIPNTDILIITGKNQQLYDRLFGKYNNISVMGYVNNIYDYMKQADVIITKPGGVTTFEAIHAEVPIIALHPFLQQEIYNAEYIHSMEIGEVVKGNNTESIQKIQELLQNGKLDVYRENISNIKKKLEDNIVTLALFLEKAIRITKNEYIAATAKNKAEEECKINEEISFNV